MVSSGRRGTLDSAVTTVTLFPSTSSWDLLFVPLPCCRQPLPRTSRKATKVTSARFWCTLENRIERHVSWVQSSKEQERTFPVFLIFSPNFHWFSRSIYSSFILFASRPRKRNVRQTIKADWMEDAKKICYFRSDFWYSTHELQNLDLRNSPNNLFSPYTLHQPIQLRI